MIVFLSGLFIGALLTVCVVLALDGAGPPRNAPMRDHHPAVIQQIVQRFGRLA